MPKSRRIERKKSADRNVTVRLHGWPAERRMLSVVEACWMVDLEFDKGKTLMKHTVFQSDNYDEALAKYNAFVKIVED